MVPPPHLNVRLIGLGSSLHRRQRLSAELLPERLRVFRLCKAEHHVVAVVAAQLVRQRRR
jgi:hypothetical protein